MIQTRSVELTVSDTLRHLVSWGLPGGPDEPLTLDATNPDRAAASRQLAIEARWHRCTGVALAALDDGALAGPTGALRDELASHHLELLQQTLLAEADAVRVVRTLDRAGIETRILKGLATAHLDHDDPSQRMTSDADVLVRRCELDAATTALTTLIDTSESVPDRSARHVSQYGKDRTLRLLDGGWLDLHQLLAPGYWGLSLDHERFFHTGQTFTIADTTLTALAPEDRLLHALLHAGSTDEIKVQSMRDAVILAGRCDAAAIIDDRSLRPVHGLLSLGARRVARIFDVEFDLAVWAAEITPTRRERLALRTRGLNGRRDHWSGPLALPLHRWPGYVWPLLSPSPEYRRWHGRSSIAHLRSATTAISRRR